MPLLGVFFVCFSLITSIFSIFKKHKQSENPRIKIVKEILILIFTLALAMLLGGMTGMYANQYAAQRFGIIPDILSALVASFVIGYIVRWGIGRAVSRSEKQFSRADRLGNRSKIRTLIKKMDGQVIRKKPAHPSFNVDLLLRLLLYSLCFRNFLLCNWLLRLGLFPLRGRCLHRQFLQLIHHAA